MSSWFPELDMRGWCVCKKSECEVGLKSAFCGGG